MYVERRTKLEVRYLPRRENTSGSKKIFKRRYVDNGVKRRALYQKVREVTAAKKNTGSMKRLAEEIDFMVQQLMEVEGSGDQIGLIVILRETFAA